MENLTLQREEALQFINDREIAIAGASRDPKKFGNIVFKTLQSKGMNVYPVNPNTDKLDQDVCYKKLEDIPDHVKNLLIVLKPEETKKAVQEAINKGFKKIWIQNGSESTEAITMAKDAGITLISKKCILMYANPTGFHKFHMRISKLFGKY